MQRWRLSGQPRHGIGFDWGLSSRSDQAEDGTYTGPECWMPHSDGDGGSQPSQGSRKRQLDAGADCLDDEEAVERPRPLKVVRVQYRGSLAGIGVGGQNGGLYSWAGAETVQADGGSTPEPEAVVWPTCGDEWPDEEDLDWVDPQSSPSPQPSPSPPQEELAVGLLAIEVDRILAMARTNYRGILSLAPEEWGDVQAMQSKYRHLMRLLHPDKRRPEEVARAGGKVRCDEAVSMVQAALAAAKKAAEDDPRLRMQQERAKRVQEIQKQQARQAAQRRIDLQDTGQDEAAAAAMGTQMSRQIIELLNAKRAELGAQPLQKPPQQQTSSVQEDPRLRMQQQMAKRVQEIQKRQARQAAQRQKSDPQSVAQCWSCGSSAPWRKFCTDCGANREKELGGRVTNPVNSC